MPYIAYTPEEIQAQLDDEGLLSAIRSGRFEPQDVPEGPLRQAFGLAKLAWEQYEAMEAEFETKIREAVNG